jgi:hypothetical protein
MLSANDLRLNGNGINGKVAYLPCSSDHEERPAIDITPSAPVPQWRAQFPTYTHNLGWTDNDGVNHSMTLRGDSLQDILNDLKLLKGMIRTAKQKHSDSNPTQSDTQPEQVTCKIHNTLMERRVSKRTGGHYFSHKLADRELCFGRPKA